MTLVDIALLNAALAERDAAREENARLRAAVEEVCADGDHDAFCEQDEECECWRRRIRAVLAVPTADDGAERGAR